jgi:hypothetical protein
VRPGLSSCQGSAGPLLFACRAAHAFNGKAARSAGVPPRLLPADRAAAYVGCGATKFSELVDKGVMPKPVFLDDGMPRWDRLDLDAAVENLKERRCDPVKRDHDRLAERINQMKEGRP